MRSCQRLGTSSVVRYTYLIEESPPTREGLVHETNENFDLVPAGPLRIAWMSVDPADVLPDLGLDCIQVEFVDGIKRIREDELRPREDAKFIAD